MFCDETIKSVYLGQPEFHDRCGYFLDCYYDMTIHLCEPYRLIFETEHYYLSVQGDGVKVYDIRGPVDSIERDGEWIAPFIYIDERFHDVWEDYETTLFAGERLVSVTEVEGGRLLGFDDFELRLFPHLSVDEFPCTRPHSYGRMYGAERLITRKCTCGGNGELFIDFVSDYLVRCNKCHLSTFANQCACDAIEEWNDGSDLIEFADLPEEQFWHVCDRPAEYIVIDDHFQRLANDTVRCNSLIVNIDGQKFMITSRYAGNGKNDFCFETLSSFDPEMWPLKIDATMNSPILFLKKEINSDRGSSLLFSIGDRFLTISAEKTCLIISPDMINGLPNRVRTQLEGGIIFQVE
jgi:hypothetical protein